jgi:hypothetical protein
MGVGLITMTEILDPNELHAPDQYAVLVVDNASGRPVFYHPRCEVTRESVGIDPVADGQRP